jgi:hypothetical protein
MARAAGVRMVETRWRFPGRHSVVVEFSLLTTRGPTSARAEFDLESKLLISLQQWDNMERRGVPGFEADAIRYLPDLRGHSRLGPVSVVTSRVRHRDGGLYEEKTIVQHRLTGSASSCVIYASYGQPHRLE